MLKEKRPAFRTIEGWAISILLEAGAICECEEHGWMKDRTDPQVRQRAIEIARQYPPLTVSLAHATAAVERVLGSIGDTCLECRRKTVNRRHSSADGGYRHGECSTEFDYVGCHSELAASGFYNRGMMGEKDWLVSLSQTY